MRQQRKTLVERQWLIAATTICMQVPHRRRSTLKAFIVE